MFKHRLKTRVRDLKALEAVARLGLLAHNVQDRVNHLCALRVVALGPVVTGARLAKDKVVRAEELAKGASTDGIHGTGLQVHQDGAGHVAAARRLVEVDVDALQLQVRVAMVGACTGHWGERERDWGGKQTSDELQRVGKDSGDGE